MLGKKVAEAATVWTELISPLNRQNQLEYKAAGRQGSWPETEADKIFQTNEGLK